jgi:cell division protein FtsI (penicillin-binding protein 3)
MFFCGERPLAGRKWPIHDSHPHGWLSFAEVVQYSSNIGASKVADRLGAARYHRYLKAFGFGERTGIELPGETPGIHRPLDSWARIDLAVQSFGQGVSVTPSRWPPPSARSPMAARSCGLPRAPHRRPGGTVALENAPVAVRRVIGAAPRAP